MKVFFIENRYKTWFWEAVASEFQKRGHEVAWLVQNPAFSPVVGRKFVIPFPRRKDFQTLSDNHDFDEIRRSDRFLNYYGGNNRHYQYYHKQIWKCLSDVQPDVVIGESTLFHELMAVRWCRHNRVPYLHPCMVGYPKDRYCIFDGDQKAPLGASDQMPSDEECLTVAKAIRERNLVPRYMVTPGHDDAVRNHPLPGSLRDRLKIVKAYVRGEHFNTPSPLRKLRLGKCVRAHLKEWGEISREKGGIPKDLRILLYPLQMQPEANLDVWGQTYRDQAQLVRDLADSLPEGWVVCVKANPKAKYELNAALMEVLKHHLKVKPVSIEMNMAEVLPMVDLVCTVTGTVAIECVVSNIPLATLGPGPVQGGRGCVQLDSPKQISEVAKVVERGNYPKAGKEDHVFLIRQMYAISYPGVVADPLNVPSAMNPDNIRQVSEGLIRVLMT